MAAADQIAVDAEMMDADGTPNKSKLGANAILSVSLAVARAAAQDCGLPLYRYLGGPMARVLPVPMMNILNGGAHASNNVDAQEFMVVPIGAETFPEGLRMGVEVFHALKKVLEQDGPLDRGGRRGRLRADAPVQRGGARRRHAGDPERRATSRAATWPSRSTSRRRSCSRTASTSSRRATAAAARPRRWSISTPAGWTAIPIVSIEDGLAENDWAGWALLTERLHERVQLVGDDLFVTNVDRLGKGIEEGVGNAVLVKVNQIGTLTETLQCIELAKGSAYGVVISHRSGETEDTFIADLAVATGRGADQDRQRQPHRPHGQVQPAAPDRRGAGRSGALSGTGPLPAVTPARWAALAALAFALYFAVQGGEYGTTRPAAAPAGGGAGAGAGRAAAGGGGFADAGGGGHRARPAGAGAGGAGAVRDDPEGGVSVPARAGGQRLTR